jgi:hypothetical protein
LLTFFILSEEQARYAAKGRNRMSFQRFGEDQRCSVRNPLAPTAAVAYERDYLMECLGNAGFDLEKCSHRQGVWTGGSDGLSFQDIVVVEK